MIDERSQMLLMIFGLGLSVQGYRIPPGRPSLVSLNLKGQKRPCLTLCHERSIERVTEALFFDKSRIKHPNRKIFTFLEILNNLQSIYCLGIFHYFKMLHFSTRFNANCLCSLKYAKTIDRLQIV